MFFIHTTHMLLCIFYSYGDTALIIQVTVLIILKYKTQCHLAHLQCYAIITTLQFQNTFITLEGILCPLSDHSLLYEAPSNH